MAGPVSLRIRVFAIVRAFGQHVCLRMVEDEHGPAQHMNPRTAADNQLRARLMEIGERLFAERGYTATTADAIAKTAGISKKTLYRLFQTKEDLILAVVRMSMARTASIVDPIYDDRSGNFVERLDRLQGLVSGQFARINSNAHIEDLQRSAPIAWDELRQWYAERLTRFRTIVLEGLQDNAIRKDISAEQLLAIYTAMLTRCLDHTLLSDTNLQAVDLYRGFMDVFIHGLADRPTVATETIA